MLIRHRNCDPFVEPSAFIAPTAVLVGRVRIGSRSRVMYGAVLDSEGSAIEIGSSSIICENSVLRATAAGDREYSLSVADNVFIGPHTTLLGCSVEACSYVATGATVLQGATVRSGAIIAVGALVHAGAVVPEDFFVPPNTIAIGDPVKVFSPDEKQALSDAIRAIGFPKIAFGVEGVVKDRRSRFGMITGVRSEEFESHFDDVILGR